MIIPMRFGKILLSDVGDVNLLTDTRQQTDEWQTTDILWSLNLT